MSDRLELTHICPKCGNEEGVIVLPGMAVKFYYCPVCSKKAELDSQNGQVALQQ